MQKKEDLRVKKTKLAIKQALFQLLEEKPFEKISISDITSRAMINRGTFYLHYEDKFALLESIEEELLEKVETSLAMVTETSLQEALKNHTPLPHIVPVLTYVEENAQFFLLITQRNGNQRIFSKLGEKYYNRFLHIMHIENDEIWQTYSKGVMISTISTVLNTWLSRGMKEPKEEMAAYLTGLVMATLTQK